MTESKRKWTGGEWRARSFNDGPFKSWQVVSKRGQLADKCDVTVCDIYNGVKPERAEANAHLLAAAPKLFEALTAAEQALRSYQYGNSSPDLAESIADNAQAALQAALGEGE